MSFPYRSFTPNSRRFQWSSLLFVAVLVGMAIANVNAATLGPVQNVSNDSANSITPRIAQDPQGNVHVVWDSAEGSRRIRYAKGTWDGSNYVFGSSVLLADVGSFQYATPSITVAPNSRVMASWSSSSGVWIKEWNAQDGQPSGTPVLLGSGIQSTLAADSNSRFHIAWNGDFKIQYREWSGGILRADSFSDNESNRPDIAVDSNNNVHLVWDKGNGVKYRARAAGGDWKPIENLDSGNFPQIAADGKGQVHIVYSRDFNIQYCNRTFTTACSNKYTLDSAADLQPTIGATRTGSVVVVYRDSDFKGLWYASRENNAWSASLTAGDSTTIPDITARPYRSRMSVVWSRNFDIQHRLISLVQNSGDNCLTAGGGANAQAIRYLIYLPMISNEVSNGTC